MCEQWRGGGSVPVTELALAPMVVVSGTGGGEVRVFVVAVEGLRWIDLNSNSATYSLRTGVAPSPLIPRRLASVVWSLSPALTNNWSISNPPSDSTARLDGISKIGAAAGR